MELKMNTISSAILIFSVMWSINECSICDQTHPMSDIINSLSYKLAREIGGRDNYFFSPLSISVALAMVYLGAQGTTKHQMTTVLQYKMAGDGCVAHEVSKGFMNLIATLESKSDQYRILVANGAFVQKDYEVLPDFTTKLKKFFKAGIVSLDFANEAQASLMKVNDWVNNYTNGQISNLLSDPLDPMTIMILLNAVYFKGFWYHPFDESRTHENFFYFPNGTSKSTQFMAMQENVKYYHDSETGHFFVELDYAGQNISMLIALPDSVEKFPDIELNSDTLCRIRAKLASHDAIVVLPKFKLMYQRELSKIMINLGITDLFSDKADLTGIRTKRDLHVSLMVHKAVISVNEQGSEASAVSGVGIDGRRRPSNRVTFWADHAFLFCIIDKRNDAMMFVGRVTDPQY